jgi:hypothetical protein
MYYSTLVIHTARTSKTYAADAPRGVRKNGVKDVRNPRSSSGAHNWLKLESIPGGRARHYACSCGHDEGISVNEPGDSHKHVARDVHQEHLRSLSPALALTERTAMSSKDPRDLPLENFNPMDIPAFPLTDAEARAESAEYVARQARRTQARQLHYAIGILNDIKALTGSKQVCDKADEARQVLAGILTESDLA